MINSLINWFKSRWYFLTTFFPVQLFLLHLRRSHILLIFWLLLFGFVGGVLAEAYGLRYLFLAPEYLNQVDFISYFIVGITAGLFIVAYHISSYIYYSYRYPFLATLERPLWKFSINNSLLPAFFYLFYIYNIITFLFDEDAAATDILLSVGGLVTGTFLVVSFTFTYFIGTIKTLELPDEKGRKGPLRSLGELIKKGGKVTAHPESQVNYYLRTPFSIKLTRQTTHYKRQVLLNAIQQHHFSASVYFIVLILIVIGLSMVGDYEFFMIPAGATVFLIFALYLMVTGAFYTRLKTWTLTIGVLVLVLLNYLSGWDRFKTMNYAYGMDYEAPRAEYSYNVLDSLTTDSIVAWDISNELKVLDNWKAQTGMAKPALVILNVSGGGLRSALWTLKVLQEADSLTDGRLYSQLHLITGSSGGMLGAAFYRELKYRSTNRPDINPYDQQVQWSLARDLLNPTCFTLAVNDLFFRLRDVEVGAYTYTMDRGYSFDRKLSANTMGLLDRRFEEYRDLEYNASMPTLILGPSIVGDGRKLLMSTKGVSYLTFTEPYSGIRKVKEFDGVEYSRFFARQNSDNLSFLTALRLSASFPYITPLVNMPSNPSIELIDAGVRDNEGFELALRYVYTFKDWIKDNTSGVVMVQIKANRPDQIPIKTDRVTKFDKLVLPIGGVFKSFHNFQIYNKSLLMQLSRDDLELPIRMVRFSLFNEEDAVSLSWHLTKKEKERIIETFESELNQEALDQVSEYIEKAGN